MIEKEKVKEIVSEKSEREKIKRVYEIRKKNRSLGSSKKPLLSALNARVIPSYTTMNALSLYAMNAVLLLMMNLLTRDLNGGLFGPRPEDETLQGRSPDDLYDT